MTIIVTYGNLIDYHSVIIVTCGNLIGDTNSVIIVTYGNLIVTPTLLTLSHAEI